MATAAVAKVERPSYPWRRNLSLLMLVLAITVSSLSRWAQAPLPVTEVDLTGQTVIVTGASAGIGKETARVLAGWGARVIMACRDEAKARRVLEDIKDTTGSELVEVWKLDLADFSSVRAFAERFVASGLPLHILINNAGLISEERVMTVDGHELTYQTNHLGHFLLTKLLLPVLLSSAPSRAVQLSSDAHYMGKIPFDNLDREQGYGWSLLVYADSKLMNVVFARELHKRYHSSGLVSTSAHPGFVKTEFTRQVKDLKKYLIDLMAQQFARNEYQGALTTVYAATHPSGVEGGDYYSSCKAVKPNSLVLNDTLGEQLWEVSEEAVAKWATPIAG